MTNPNDEMAESAFDALARGAGAGAVSRGKVVQAVFAGLLGGLVSRFAASAPDAEASKRQLTTLWAVVDPDGNLVHGKGVTASANVGVGSCEVTFNRNVSGCAYSGILDGKGGFMIIGHQPEDTGRLVRVYTYETNSNPAAKPFHLVVHC